MPEERTPSRDAAEEEAEMREHERELRERQRDEREPSERATERGPAAPASPARGTLSGS